MPQPRPARPGPAVAREAPVTFVVRQPVADQHLQLLPDDLVRSVCRVPLFADRLERERASSPKVACTSDRCACAGRPLGLLGPATATVCRVEYGAARGRRAIEGSRDRVPSRGSP